MPLQVGGEPAAPGAALISRFDQALACFVSTVEQTPMVAIYSIDREARVLQWNGACTELYGIPVERALGQQLSTLLQRTGREQEFSALLERQWQTGQTELPLDWHIQTVGGSAHKHWVYSSIFPLVEQGSQGSVRQIVCMEVDIEGRTPLEQNLYTIGSHFRTLFNQSDDAIILIRDAKFQHFNPAALKMFGYQHAGEIQEFYPEHFSPALQPDGQPSRDKARAMYVTAERKGNHRFDWMHANRIGQTFWTEVLYTTISTGESCQMYAVIRDISVRKAAEQSLHLAAQVFAHSREAIQIVDRQQRIISVNRAFTDISGYPPWEVIGKQASIFSAGRHDELFLRQLWETLARADHWEGEMWDQRQDGRTYPQWLAINVVRDRALQVSNYIVIFSDMTERKAAEVKTRHLAEYDFLTDLPNRFLLLDRLGQSIAAARRSQTKLALLFLDLDRFKNINDSLGHHIGDKLLQEVASRLKKCVRGIDTVSRQGGDEFVILLADIGSADQAAHIAGTIMQTIGQPCRIEEYELNITTCIGISLYPCDGQNIDLLIKNADIAMYHAKENGRNRYQFFNADMNMRIVERMLLENSLKSALDNDEFYLQYQPEIDLASGRIIGAEALIRWEHPEFGMLSPTRFIAVAEDCGLIMPIGEWVLRSACRQARAWLDDGMPMVVSVNVSVAQFRQENLFDTVTGALQDAGLEARYLELEITEGIILDSTESIIATLHALKNQGITLAIDDFGTGYSSLSYLKRFPIDKIKIDQSFIRDLIVDADDAAIVRAIVAMAKNLKLKVIAEGVETVEQFEFLQAIGCDQYQGFYLSKALSPADLRQFRRLH